MKKLELGERNWKNTAQVSNAVRRMSANSPRSYFFVSIIFSCVDVFESDKLPASDHSAHDWPLGYWHAGEHKAWSDARKVRAQNAGPQYDR